MNKKAYTSPRLTLHCTLQADIIATSDAITISNQGGLFDARQGDEWE